MRRSSDKPSAPNISELNALAHGGVTLVEMVVVIVILAIALTTITQMVSQATVQGAFTYDETMAIELGQSYVSEIMGRRYDENSPLGGVPPCGAPSAAACSTSFNDGESRANYDDVDDYDGLDELPQRVDGSGGVEARGGYENFRVAVSVSQATSTAKRITVTVTQPNSESIDFTVYKTNF
jgi:MSHA pilin protein MshD